MAENYDELLQRIELLEVRCRHGSGPGDPLSRNQLSNGFAEAASAIRALQAENEKLRERYECNTTIMHARTAALARVTEERDAAIDKLRSWGYAEDANGQLQIAQEQLAALAPRAEAYTEAMDALATAILGSDYGDRCHDSPLTPARHTKTPPEFVAWARARLGDVDPTCQGNIKLVIERDQAIRAAVGKAGG